MNARRSTIVWSPESESDLIDIWKYSAEAAGTASADALLFDIEATVQALAAFPELGAERNNVRDGLRARYARRYVIFYQTRKDTVEIVRVLSERRDVDVIF